MSDWRPIETAPKDGTHILLAHGREVVVGFWWKDDKCHPWFFLDPCDPPHPWSMNAMQDGQHGPTHWMPLPDPPEAPGAP